MSDTALMNGMTAEQWLTCTGYGGDPFNIVGTITLTTEGGGSARPGPSTSTEEADVKTNKLNEVLEWGLRGRDWQKVALIGIPSALVVAGLVGWYFGGRKRRG